MCAQAVQRTGVHNKDLLYYLRDKSQMFCSFESIDHQLHAFIGHSINFASVAAEIRKHPKRSYHLRDLGVEGLH
jgi:hypothetical protein